MSLVYGIPLRRAPRGPRLAGRPLERRRQGVVFVPFQDGRPAAGPESFVSGFVPDPAIAKVWGRPVGLLQLPDGSLLVSDDGAGSSGGYPTGHPEGVAALTVPLAAPPDHGGPGNEWYAPPGSQPFPRRAFRGTRPYG
ncbi:MAG: hypothetical protein ACREX8_20690, partial [Gammaproteobacteria bacterium]